MTERHFTALRSPLEVALQGVRLIEAGAGTGKTWTLAALVLRLLLERRLEIGKILVVTFTKAATAELRGRIRARLAEALAAFTAGQSNDDYLRALLERHDAGEAVARLRLALESFDEAAVFTIHGFCQRALNEMALQVGQAFERELIADQSELLSEVARDVWRREMAQASPLWAQFLINNLKGPQGLVDKIDDHLARGDVQVGRPHANDRSAAEQHLWQSWHRARGLWDAKAIGGWLHGADLRGNIYPARKIDAAVAAADAWLAETMPLLPAPEPVALLTLRKVEQGRKKESPMPEHPFFAAMDALWQAMGDFETAAGAALRSFVADFLLLARDELARRKQAGGLQSYDDLLSEFAVALDGAQGEHLIEALRARYAIALVDEFQDTDTLQLRIFTRIFGTARHPLIFVGDPKQAIYSFRGADIFAYLAARGEADAGHALLENRRSDKPLLSALNALFARPRPFLLDDLPYEPAQAANVERPRCDIDDEAAPFTLWLMEKPVDARSFTKETAKAMAAEAVSADIARLLQLATEGRASVAGRRLKGSDIAVLVRTHRDGELVRQALQRRGIPSVSGGGGSVWKSAEAEEIERLLIAIAQPSREALVRAALATVLLGADAAQLAAWREDDPAWSARLERFHDDLALLREEGFIAMWRRLLRRENVVARMLARPDGERRLTNYRHLAELLQAAEQSLGLDAEGLARHIAAQRVTVESDEVMLRLESDAQLVRIVTQHAAKGLQYPIVYCPFLWLGRDEKKGWPTLAHLQGQPFLDFGSPQAAEILAAAEREAAAEELRLAYVALTRAEHRCIVIWGKVNNCARSPLAWLLFRPAERVAGDPRQWLQEWLEKHDETIELHALEAQLNGAFKVMPLPERGGEPLQKEIPEQALRPRPFLGHIPEPWRVRSFSSLVAALAEEGEGADYDALPSWGGAVPPAPSFRVDSAPGGTLILPPAPSLGSEAVAEARSSVTAPTSIQDFPRGTRAGSCLHALFERIDFQFPHTVAPVVASVLAEYGYAPDWQTVLERLVTDVLTTPLTDEGLRLADVPRHATLREMEFTFPLASQEARAGYMKGFIDLVFQANGRWYIVDWKSNWLEDYGSAALATAMQTHHYDLQLRIYAAALKRALALRESQHDWETVFGGVFYLFVRGMRPGSTDGVFFVRPAISEIEACLDEAIR